MAFRSEVGQSKSSDVLATFTDLRKRYDHVGHSDLVHEAVAAQYPLPILRLSLFVYTSPRRLLRATAVGPEIIPTRSTIAGSAAPTYELKALMVRLLSRHVRLHPSTSLS